MAVQRTFSIIKPDATRRNLTGAVNTKLEDAGLRIIVQKRIHMAQAGGPNADAANDAVDAIQGQLAG